MLTDANREELKQMGPQNSRRHLAAAGGSGVGSAVLLKSGYVSRGDIYEWLAEYDAADDQRQSATLYWAKIAGWMSIAALLVGIAGLAVSLWK